MSDLTNKTATKTFEEIVAEYQKIQDRLDKKAKGPGFQMVYQISDRAIYYLTNGSKRKGYSVEFD
jgi:hypothetical protein